MKSWTFSGRAAIAWLLGSLASGAILGMTLDIVNVMTSPEDKGEFAIDGVALIFGGGVCFLVLTALPLLLASLVWRAVKWWPRPWAEMIVTAAICVGLVHAPGVNVSFEFDGPSSQVYNALAFFCVQILPALTGLLAPFVYWLIAKPQRL